MRTQIKICGITSTEDARSAIEAGADALGLVFYGPSVRNVEVAQAAEIVKCCGPFITTVGLFVNPTYVEVMRVLEGVPLQVLQFHGTESPDFCAQFNRPYIKAFSVNESAQLDDVMGKYSSAIGWLVDAPAGELPGGNGLSFDWAKIPAQAYSKLVLAGGLNPSNVGPAIKQLAPLGVDVSSGVERSKGIKSKELIEAFCLAVKSMDVS